MSKKGLHGHYGRLTPEERFRLDVLAMAREDSRESERLVSSCPRFSYTMNDVGFAERWRSAIEITLRVYIPLGEQLAKLRMVDAFRVFVPYSQTLSSNMALDAWYQGAETFNAMAAARGGESVPGGGVSVWLLPYYSTDRYGDATQTFTTLNRSFTIPNRIRTKRHGAQGGVAR